MSRRARRVYRVSERVPARNSRLVNPYSVGHTGATARDYLATCQCCEIEFIVRARQAKNTTPSAAIIASITRLKASWCLRWSCWAQVRARQLSCESFGIWRAHLARGKVDHWETHSD